MTLDPVTLWLYRGVLVAVGLACLALAIYALSRAVHALSRAGTMQGIQGLDGMLGWLMGKKTYLISAAVPMLVVLNQFEYLSDGMTNTLLMLLGAGGLATLRAGQAKAEKVAGEAVVEAKHAVTAAKVSAIKVEEAVSTVVAKVEEAVPPAKPLDVPGSPLPPIGPGGVSRVPRERDLT